MDGGYLEVYKSIRKYIAKEVLTQLYSFTLCVISRRTLLSSVDVLGNLQYFKSEKEDLIQNTNYFSQSIENVYTITLSSQLAPSLHLPFSQPFSPCVTPEKASMHKNSNPSSIGKAIGKTVDGMAHVSSKV